MLDRVEIVGRARLALTAVATPRELVLLQEAALPRASVLVVPRPHVPRQCLAVLVLCPHHENRQALGRPFPDQQLRAELCSLPFCGVAHYWLSLLPGNRHRDVSFGLCVVHEVEDSLG